MPISDTMVLIEGGDGGERGGAEAKLLPPSLIPPNLGREDASGLTHIFQWALLGDLHLPFQAAGALAAGIHSSKCPGKKK